MGRLSWAEVARPLSPEKPGVPVPAMVVMMPVVTVELADAVVVGVGEVEIVDGVEGEALRGVELGGGGGAVVAGEALCAGAGDGGDVAGRCRLCG